MATTLFENSGDDTINLVNQTISTAPLSKGLHHLFVRARFTSGMWSVVSQRSFYVTSPTNSDTIAGAEYFVDSDPGIGNGFSLSVNPSDTLRLINQILPSSNLTPGIHHLFVRTKNETGVWSVATQRSFYVVPSATTDSIKGWSILLIRTRDLAMALLWRIIFRIQLNWWDMLLWRRVYTRHPPFVCSRKINLWYMVCYQSKPFYVKPGEEVFEISALEYFMIRIRCRQWDSDINNCRWFSIVESIQFPSKQSTNRKSHIVCKG